MFSILKKGLGVFYSSPARLLRFSLNNALRPYLKDELQQGNFDVQMWQGTVNIENLELNEDVLNVKLNGSPFHIESAKIGRLTMDIPWRTVATQPVRVVLQDITICLTSGPATKSDQEVEHYVEKCIEKSLETSQYFAENDSVSVEQVDHAENLGIQPVEELFENIFAQMNMSLRNIQIQIRHQEQAISLTINDVTVQNDESPQKDIHKDSEPIRKLATLQDCSIDIISPADMKGNIVKLSSKSNVHISYEQNDKDKRTMLGLNIIHGMLSAVMVDKQVQFLNQFISNFLRSPTNATHEQEEKKMSESIYSSASSSLGSSVYESSMDDSSIYETQLEALEKSIISIGPYGGSTDSSGIFELSLKLRVKQANCVLHNQAERKKFTIALQELALSMHKAEDKTALAFHLENIRIVEASQDATSTVDLLKLGSKNEPLRGNLELFTKKQQRITDAKLTLPVITVMCAPKSWEALLQIIKSAPPPEMPSLKRSSRSFQQEEVVSTILHIKIPLLQVLCYFPSYLQKNGRGISLLEVKVTELRVHKIPLEEPTSSKLAVEFISLQSFITMNDTTKSDIDMDELHQGKRYDFLNVWTTDSDDIPRLEVITQEPSIFVKPVSTMIDLEKAFSPPLFFSNISRDCKHIAPLGANGTIDLERTKQISSMILDIIFPCFSLTMNKEDFSFWGGLLSQFSSDSTSSSSVILAMGTADITLHDGTTKNISDYRLELKEMRMFQSSLYQKEKSGYFIFLNAKDVKLVDNDNATLLRNPPEKLNLAEIYCPPFAINLPLFQLSVNDHLVRFEGATVGFKPGSWKKLINIFFGSDDNTDQPPSNEKPEEATSSETKIELYIKNPCIYYQPFDMTSVKSGVYVTPPRAVITLGLFTMKWSTTTYWDIRIDRLGLWLKEDFHYLKNNETYVNLFHPELISHFKSKSLIEVLTLVSLDLTIQTKGECTEVILNCLRNQNDNTNQLNMSIRPDSLQTLIKAASLFGDDLSRELATLSPKSKPTVKVEQTAKLTALPQIVDDYNAKESRVSLERSRPIDIKPNRARSNSKTQSSPSPSKDFTHSVILFDEEAPQKQTRAPGTTESIEESWEWIGRTTIDPSSKYKETEEKIFPTNIPKSSSVKICNLQLCIKLLGGNDWDNEELYTQLRASQHRSNKAIEGRGDSVELHIEIPMITYDTFASLQNDWRLTVDLKSLMIDDHVNTSHHAKLLTFSRKSKPTSVIKLILEQLSSGAKKFKLSVAPMRLYLDQDTVTFLLDFFTYSTKLNQEAEVVVNTAPEEGTLFEYFEMSAIDSIIDYKPRNTINQVYSDVRLRNHIWAIKVMELNKAPITLSGLKLYKVKDTNELTNAMMETWVKDFKHVLHYLSGTRIGQSVQIGLNIGYGVVDLIKTPVEEYNKGGNVLKGIGMGATSLAKTVTVELLNIGASSAITTKKMLDNLDKAIGTPRSNDAHISAYANQPENATQGAQQAASSIKSGFENAANALYYGGLSGVPTALLRPVIGTLDALSNITLGFRNTLDKSAYELSQEKYKSGSPPSPSESSKKTDADKKT